MSARIGVSKRLALDPRFANFDVVTSPPNRRMLLTLVLDIDSEDWMLSYSNIVHPVFVRTPDDAWELYQSLCQANN